MIILGIETSCDETSSAVLDEGIIKSNIVSSQIIHQKYGGVVPELASRAHQRLIVPIVNESLVAANVDKNNLDGIAVTYGPGLMGALLVGVSFAKALAYSLQIPIIGINHMEAHLYSNFISEKAPNYPYLCLIVSGGHTQIVLVNEPLKHELLGETLDDAAGEAYDKVAKMLGLGFPGGPLIDELAQKGNSEFINFPRSYLGEDNFNFSFSGIKTSVLYWLRDHNLQFTNNQSPITNHQLSDICASFQAAIIEVLVAKIFNAIKKYNIHDVAIAGGVSANSELRKQLITLSGKHNFKLHIPKLEYCTDNAAMVAMVGWMKLKQGYKSDSNLSAVPNLQL